MKRMAVVPAIAVLALAGCSHGRGAASLTVGDLPSGAAVSDASMPSVEVTPASSPAEGTVGTGTTGPGTVITPEPNTTPTPTPTPTPKPSPKSGPGDIEVTNADNGATVHLRAGQRLKVHLTPDGGSWDPPTSANESVVARQSSSGGYPSNDPADAVFVGMASGSADITSMTDMACLHTNPRCLPPQREWSIHVVVA